MSQNSDPSREIVITRTYQAPRQLVWNAMTDPRHVIQWWGPRGFSTKIETMEVRVGGVWQHTMTGPDGTNYPNKSIFTEVVAPERLTYTHAGSKEGGAGIEFTCTWTFEALSETETRLTIHQVYPTAEMRDRTVREFGAIEGGKQCLARLEEFLTDAPVVVERTLAAPVEKVWQALTEVEALRQWSFALPAFRAEAGFQFTFVVEHEGARYEHLCEVKTAEPPTKLAYTWRYAGEPGDSLVTFELTPAGEQTHLKLTHAGVHTFPPRSEYARTNFARGWESISASLAGYLGG